MSLERIMVVGSGTLAMLVLMLLRRKRYPMVAGWKYPVISIFLAACGVVGALLMHYIENGDFGGTSFFGAIFFVPVLMLPMLVLRIPYSRLLDLCAPAECLMLAILKLDCMHHGCCRGIVLFQDGMRNVRFPSREIEMLVSLGIMFLLVHLERDHRSEKKLYPYYLILYGVTRFCLNWLRDGLSPFVWLLPPGNFWSIIAICVGIIWLLLLRKRFPNSKS